MSGQSTMKTVKEVKNCIKAIEHNKQMEGGSGGTEMNKQTGNKKIDKK